MTQLTKRCIEKMEKKEEKKRKTVIFSLLSINGDHLKPSIKTLL